MVIKTPFMNQGKLSDLKCYSCLKNENLRLCRFMSNTPLVLAYNLVYGGMRNMAKEAFNLLYKNIDREITLGSIFEYVEKNKAKVSYRLRY